MCVGAHVGGQRTASRTLTLPSSSTMRVLKIECKATGLAERSLSTETFYGFHPLLYFGLR